MKSMFVVNKNSYFRLQFQKLPEISHSMIAGFHTVRDLKGTKMTFVISFGSQS